MLHALDMGMLRCLLLLVQGQGEALERETRELLSQVQAADSPSYEGEVRFFQALACGQSPNLATLEWLATRLEVSPVAARRARVLLGGEAALDRLDRRLLDGLQSLGGFGRLLSLQGHRKIPAHLGHCQSEVGGAKWAERSRRVVRPFGEGERTMGRPRTGISIVYANKYYLQQRWARMNACELRGGGRSPVGCQDC